MRDFQKDIIRRHGLASMGASLFTLLFLIATSFVPDAERTSHLWVIVTTYWLGQSILLWWVISGRSRSLKDPAMTAVFMCWAITFLSFALYCCREYRTIAMLGYLTVMPYGVFRLSWRGFLGVALFAMTSYATVMMTLLHKGGVEWDVQREALFGFAFLASLAGYSLLGREVAILREAYRLKNRELRKAMGRIEELAVTDELTGLYNRRYLLRSMERARALMDREDLPFVLAFVDIDHFKQINDRHGHRVGDQVLAELAQLLRVSVREIDVAARYGGEEFVLLLSGLQLEAAEKVLDRIRISVMQQQFSESGLPLTVSIGVAEYIAGEDSDELINRADRLLYEAKRAGRNMVVADHSVERKVLSSESEEA